MGRIEWEPTEELLRELDKGIDDMEAGRVRPHAETMAIIREQIKVYALRYHRQETEYHLPPPPSGQ